MTLLWSNNYFIVIFIRTPLWTGLIVLLGCYLFIFNSGMECNTLSQRCGRLYYSVFLVRVGLFTLTYMASLIALGILLPSMPMILKFSTEVVWWVLFWCSKIGAVLNTFLAATTVNLVPDILVVPFLLFTPARPRRGFCHLNNSVSP